MAQEQEPQPAKAPVTVGADKWDGGCNEAGDVSKIRLQSVSAIIQDQGPSLSSRFLHLLRSQIDGHLLCCHVDFKNPR